MTNQSKRKPLITDKELRGYIAASQLTPTQRGTLLMAADALIRHDLRIIASYDRLRVSIGVARRTIIYRMKSLEQSGVLTKVRGGGGRYENGKGRVNIWRLDVEALKKQAEVKADQLEANEQNEPIKIPEKGAASCTGKGAANTHQGCNKPTATVQSDAHDPILPISQEKKTNGIARPSHPRGGGSMPKHNLNELRPWVNKYDAPKQSRASKLKQMHMQLEWDRKNQQRASNNRIH